MMQGPLPVSGEPLELASASRGSGRGCRRRRALRRSPPALRGCARAWSSSPRTHQNSGRARRGAVEVLEREPERSSISTPRSSRPGVSSAAYVSAWPRARSHGEKRDIIQALGLLERRPGVRRGRRGRRPRRCVTSSERPGSERTATSSPTASASASSQNRTSVGASRWRVEASAKRTSARSTPDGTSASSCSSIAPLVPRRRRDGGSLAARRRRVPREHRIVRRQLGCELDSSAAAAVAPRAAACSAAASSSEAAAASVPSAAAQGGGPAPRCRRLLRPAPGGRRGASRAEPARNRSRRAADGRSEAARIVELDDAFPDGCGRAPRTTRSWSPCAAATDWTVGRASAAAWTEHLVGLSRQPSEAPAEQLLQALGDPQRLARLCGRVSVRTSSRPSSSAKKGLPPVASRTRTSSGRVSSSPSRSARRCGRRPG